MENFTPWTLFVDLGVISCLLLVCKWMRVKLRLMQKFFVPPSLAAGFLGLAFGPGGMDVLPLSSQLGTYAGILIAFIFGSLAITSQRGDDARGHDRGSRIRSAHHARGDDAVLPWQPSA